MAVKSLICTDTQFSEQRQLLHHRLNRNQENRRHEEEDSSQFAYQTEHIGKRAASNFSLLHYLAHWTSATFLREKDSFMEQKSNIWMQEQCENVSFTSSGSIDEDENMEMGVPLANPGPAELAVLRTLETIPNAAASAKHAALQTSDITSSDMVNTGAPMIMAHSPLSHCSHSPSTTMHDEIINYVQSGQPHNHQSTEPFLATTKCTTVAAWQLCWQRIGWLGFFLVSLSVTAVVMRDFETALKSQVQLAYFVPLLAGHGGNTGGQAVSAILAALAADLITLRDAPRLIYKEPVSGFLIGVLLGVVIGPVSYLILNISGPVSVVVALTLPPVSSMASTLGAGLPFACLAVGFDPNVIAAPAMTSVVDVCGILCYFIMANHVFAMLGLSL
mmetsp:Transcript_20139/g.43431  ORF Transcript_20139/g.43431 Transcript_20139/m.43431 type:complete len:389 (-) Transcript_20139:1935-3101(-)